MAEKTYSAGDFIGKTIFITANVPVYASPTRVGETKPAAKKFLKNGDSFLVDTFINKDGTYVKYDDHYWVSKYDGYISFKDIAGKYNTSALISQGLQSDEDKAKTTESKFMDMLKKYGTITVAVIGLGYLLNNMRKK